jgi:hypothetical protein
MIEEKRKTRTERRRRRQLNKYKRYVVAITLDVPACPMYAISSSVMNRGTVLQILAK